MGIVRRLINGPSNVEITTSEGLAAFLLSSSRTWAGVEVTATEAMKDPGWFAGLRNIAEDIGKLPFILYEAGDSRKRATTNTYWRLVNERWTTRWTSQQAREYMTFWAAQDGDSYALKNVIRGVIREMAPFRRGEVEKDTNDAGDFIYHTRLNGERVTLTRREVFHLEGFAMNQDGGAKLFQMSREDIALSLAAERHGATYFGNGAHPSMGIKVPAELSDAAYERLNASIKEEFSRENAHSPILYEGGSEPVSNGDSNQESQFTETRRFQVVQHARRIRIPPHKVSDLERAHFNNVEQENTNYVVDSLLPWALRWENAINQQVIGTDLVYAELLFEMLLRGDAKTRSEVYAAAIQNGWMTENEVRRRENLPPIEGGDVLYAPANLLSPQQRQLAMLKVQAEVTSILVRAGFDPAGSLQTAGLAPIEWTGVVSAPDAAPEREREPASA